MGSREKLEVVGEDSTMVVVEDLKLRIGGRDSQKQIAAIHGQTQREVEPPKSSRAKREHGPGPPNRYGNVNEHILWYST